MSLIQSLQTALLDRLFGTGGVIRIGNGADSYVGVCTSNPGDTGATSDEVDYGGRRQILASEWDAPTSSQTTNNGLMPVWFVPAPTTLRFWLLGDTSTVNSTHDYSRPLSSDTPVVTSDQIRFPVGGLIVSVTGLLTHTYGNDQLDMLLRNLTPTQPTNYYYALSTTTPSADGTNFTEPSGNGYARVELTRGAIFGSAFSGAPSTITNNQSLIFTYPTGSWGTVTHWGAYDASTGGNLLLYGELDAATGVATGEQPEFTPGNLTLTME